MADPLACHLRQLEAESIGILREVAAAFERPVMLYSIGKDSSAMLHVARKAFFPGRLPFPLLHVDTTWKFQEMIAFRDRTARELGLDMIVHVNQEGIRAGTAGSQNLALLGIGTTADATNPFSAKLNNALWTAKTTAEDGSGDLRYKLNKESAAKTLSLLMQTNYSGRAEIGLTGDDDFRLKVSPDGSAWHEALVADHTSGQLTFPQGAVIPDGLKLANAGTSTASGLDLEGGGTLGKVGLVIKSVVGVTGAQFQQRAAPESGIDLIDFRFQTLSQNMLMRVESRAVFAFTGGTPEFQILDSTPVEGVPASNYLFAISPKQARCYVPFSLQNYAKAGLPAANSVNPGALVYVSDAAGGAVPAYSDGTSWRRVTDASVVN